ncbi:SLATT domain-containing protein [Desulfitobacterium sp. THU1]|uniref:SLATT domain-containing protein n=1 Tax=Desulfitobacterium sp. THU1 TaxID=3138072 RepID=UPI00311F6900
MVQSSISHKKDLKVQVREAYGRLVYSYTTHLKQVEQLTNKNKRIKYWQIALSAISTGGFLGAVVTNQIIMTWIGGIVSTALLALNLFFKDFNLIDDIKKHRSTADDLWIVRERYISLLTDFDALNEEVIMKRRDELQDRTAEIYRVASSTNSRSYSAAQKALKEDEEQLFRASEIDKMLPEHLREANIQNQKGESMY